MASPLFYKKAANYWANKPATIDGVLGGFGNLSDIDIKGSREFLEKVFALENPPGTNLALDCGAGIGRVTKHLLLARFDKVDLLEQDEKFINAAKQSIDEHNPKLGTIYHDGLHKFKFEKQKKYDVIWCQWVLCHVKDYDFVNFLNKCMAALKDTGVIIVKENVTEANEIDFDEDDSTITRPVSHMIELFKDAKLKVIISELQKGFPEDNYPVYSFLLTPIVRKQVVVI